MRNEILVTGFDAFADLDENVSQEVVRLLPEAWRAPAPLRTAVLPTAYDASARRIRELIAAHDPAAIVLLGLARGTEEIQLERVALNLADSETADNERALRRGEPIEAAAPVGYWSTLPLDAMRARLQCEGVPVRISNHAGTFVCNHAFFVARAEIARRGGDTPCGFVHLPDADPGALVAAVVSCLEVVVQTLAHPADPHDPR